MRHNAKFHADRSIRYGVMAVFRFFKMAAVRHLGIVLYLLGPPTMRSRVVFIVVQNLVGISRVVLKICEF